MTPELVSLLNSYSVPAGICDDLGNWVALNGKLQKLLAPSLHENLSRYIASESEWRNAWHTICGSRQISLPDTRLKAPLAGRFAQ